MTNASQIGLAPAMSENPSRQHPRMNGHRVQLGFRTASGPGRAWRFFFVMFLALSSHGEDFRSRIQPMLQEYCLKCHSTEKHKGDLDLERFSSLDEVMKHPKVWQAVAEQLANSEMPPKDKPQPNPE